MALGPHWSQVRCVCVVWEKKTQLGILYAVW